MIAVATAKKLLDGVRPDEFRVFAIEALRRWRGQSAANYAFSVYDHFSVSLIQLLAAKKGISADAHQVNEPFLFGQSEAWMQPLIDFFAWLVGSGLAIPLYGEQAGTTGYAAAYRLTTAGSRVLDADEDHPLLPGFVQRVVRRCKGLPREVAAHLVDAQVCLDHRLGRPAVVLAGLAYEVAEDAVIDHLGSRISLRRGTKAAEKIDVVKKAIPVLFTGNSPKESEKRGSRARRMGFRRPPPRPPQPGVAPRRLPRLH